MGINKALKFSDDLYQEAKAEVTRLTRELGEREAEAETLRASAIQARAEWDRTVTEAAVLREALEKFLSDDAGAEHAQHCEVHREWAPHLAKCTCGLEGTIKFAHAALSPRAVQQHLSYVRALEQVAEAAKGLWLQPEDATDWTPLENALKALERTKERASEGEVRDE